MSFFIWIGVVCVFWIFCLSSYGKKLELTGEGGWLREIFYFTFSGVRDLLTWFYTTKEGSFVFMSILASIAASYLFFDTLNPFKAASDLIRGARYKHYDNLKKQGGHEKEVRKFEEKENRKIVKIHEARLKNNKNYRDGYERSCISSYNFKIRDKENALRNKNYAMKELKEKCIRPYTESCKRHENILMESDDKMRYLKTEEKRHPYPFCEFFIRKSNSLVRKKYEEFHKEIENY